VYNFTLALHNLLRWVALVLVIVATVRAFLGWFGKRQWSESDRRIGSFSAMAIDIQLLIGLLLYLVLSPITRSAFQDIGAVMEIADLRFFVLEHAFYMLLAVVFAHLGSALPKRADDSRAKYQRAAIFFALTLLMILLGMPWSRPWLPGLG
jgi:hypothetical protein